MTKHQMIIMTIVLFSSLTPVRGRGDLPVAEEHVSGAGQSGTVTITVLYDNYRCREGTRNDWGFSCLVEGAGEPLLFDTGARADVLEHNIRVTGCDIKQVKHIIISHNHGDHTGGLLMTLGLNHNLTVHLPGTSPQALVRQVELTGAVVQQSQNPVQLNTVAWLTGELPGIASEQSLLVRSSRGWILIAGCSHPGIINILKRANEVVEDRVVAVIGGLHLLDHSPEQIQTIIHEMKMLGVEYCGATHCTGDRAIALFREAFGDRFMDMGTGRIPVF